MVVDLSRCLFVPPKKRNAPGRGRPPAIGHICLKIKNQRPVVQRVHLSFRRPRCGPNLADSAPMGPPTRCDESSWPGGDAAFEPQGKAPPVSGRSSPKSGRRLGYYQSFRPPPRLPASSTATSPVRIATMVWNLPSWSVSPVTAKQVAKPLDSGFRSDHQGSASFMSPQTPAQFRTLLVLVVSRY